MSEIRGLEKKHEQRARALVRDTRPLTHRFLEFIRTPETAAGVIACMALATVLAPQIADLLLCLGIINFIMSYTYKAKLPFRMPVRAAVPDFNDINVGTNKPNMARGICFFGNERSTNRELWFSNDDMRTHVLIFGSTGSGKTETLVSLAYNALIQGSGFIYVDGKGDNSLFAKVFSMTRSMGREDDLLLVNFMTGAKDIVGPQKSRISNTMNPFSRGSSSMLAQLVISMMDSSSNSPDGDMWKGRAISFIEALMKVLVYMRDQSEILLDANSIRQYFNLPKLEQIAIDKKFPISETKAVDIANAPEVVIEPIYNYLQTLPGYNTAKKGNQSGEVWEQHGFITMQLTRAFSSLADTYGHIIRTKLAEVDFKDVVLNRRILVCLLPALEKSPEELANLGKIIVASLKCMMASGLGEEVEGTYRNVIERKPTNAPTPYMCILDEYGYYAVPGFAVVPAQARSLGFSAIFAGQDLPAFQKASKEEAASIGANTNIKICMKMEDPAETFEFFQKSAGQAYVTRTAGFQVSNQSITNTYTDNKSTQVEKQDRIELQDLKDQREGEMHIFFRSNIVRAKSFFCNPKPAPYMKLNQMLKVDAPPDETIMAINNRIYQFEDAFDEPNFLYDTLELDEDLQFFRDSFDNQSNEDLHQLSINALAEFYQQEHMAEQESLFDDEEEEDFQGMDIFTQPSIDFPDLDDFDPLSLLNMPTLVGSLLDKRDTKRDIERIQRFIGATKSEATAIADKLISDIRTATHYPPEYVQTQDIDDIIKTMQDVTQFFQTRPDKTDTLIEGQMDNEMNPSESNEFSLPELPELDELKPQDDAFDFSSIPDFAQDDNLVFPEDIDLSRKNEDPDDEKS